MELRVARAASSKVGGAAHAGCTLPGYHDDSEGANGDESTGVCVQLPIFVHATYFYWHKKERKKGDELQGPDMSVQPFSSLQLEGTDERKHHSLSSPGSNHSSTLGLSLARLL